MNDLYNAAIGFAVGEATGQAYKNQRRYSFFCNEIKANKYKEKCIPLSSPLWDNNTNIMLLFLKSMKYKYIDENREKPPMTKLQITEREEKIKNNIVQDFKRKLRRFHQKNNFLNIFFPSNNRTTLTLSPISLIIPLAFIKEKNQEKIMEYIKLLNATSKDDITADVGCLICILLLRELTYKKNIEEALRSVADNITEDYKIPEYNRIWGLSILYETEDNIISRGFPADVIEASIWCCCNNLSYKNAVLAAVNLGGETDTIAALTGALASVLYENIPEEWIKHIKRENMIKNMCNIFIKKENRGG